MEAPVRYRRETVLTALPVLRLLPWLGLGWVLARGLCDLLPDLPGWPLVFGPPLCTAGWLFAGRWPGPVLLPLALACVLAMPWAKPAPPWFEPRSGLVLQCLGQEPATRSRWQVVWRLWLPDSLGRCSPGVRVLQRSDTPLALTAGDRVLLPPRSAGGTGRLQCRPPVNPFGFAEDEWLARLGCGASLTRTGLDHARQVPPRAPALFFDRLESLRLAWREGLRRHIAGRLQHTSGAFMISLLLGDRSGLEQARSEGWRASGLAHLLALSGMHVSLMAVLMAQIMSLLRFPPGLRDTVLVLFLPLYVWICGWPASVVRAALMALLLLLARRLERPQHLFAVLVLGAEIQVLLQPGQAFDVGFQLSYLAVAALALCPAWLPAVTREVGRIRRYLLLAWGGLLTSISVTVFTAGVTFGVFGRLPLGGMVLNLVAIPVCDGLLAVGLFHCLCRLPGDPLPALCELSIVVLDRFAAWGSDARTHLLWRPGPGWALWLCVLPFVLLHPRAWQRRGAGLLLALCLAGAVWTVDLARMRLQDRGLELLALDVDQGDATLILAPGGERVLVDAGLKDPYRDMGRRILPVLRELAPDGLDWLVLTHADTDHIGGALTLLRSLPVRALLTNGPWNDNPLCDSLQLVCDSLGLAVRYARPGMELARDPRWRLRVLGPPPAGGLPEGNESSVILRVEGGGASALLPGDAGLPAERWLMGWGPLLDTDVLKLGHHGSRHSTSARWLQAVSPELALVSCGRGNRYGHPHPEVLANVDHARAALRRSDHRRAVWLRFEAGVVRELEWKGRPPGPLYSGAERREEP